MGAVYITLNLMQDDPGYAQMKDEMLALMNESRKALGMSPLTEFPERCCAFCGKGEEEAGRLYAGAILDFIHICRDCTVSAQRSFIKGLPARE